jgi:single-strand DNA-binding protein
MQQIFIAGRIGKDAVTRVSQSGVKATNFSVASSYKVKGEDRTDWFDCTVFDDRGEKLAPYLTKGTAVAITGQVSARAYTKDGEARASLQVTVDKIEFMSSRKQDGGDSGGYGSGYGGGHPPAGGQGDLDDEIPF